MRWFWELSLILPAIGLETASKCASQNGPTVQFELPPTLSKCKVKMASNVENRPRRASREGVTSFTGAWSTLFPCQNTRKDRGILIFHWHLIIGRLTKPDVVRPRDASLFHQTAAEVPIVIIYLHTKFLEEMLSWRWVLNNAMFQLHLMSSSWW